MADPISAPVPFDQKGFEAELKKGRRLGLLDLSRFDFVTLPPAVLELRELRGIELGPFAWNDDEGPIRRIATGFHQYWKKRPFNDLGALAKLPALEAVELSCCRFFDSLEPLGELPALRRLGICSCKHLTDFTPLQSLTGLEELDASETKLLDFSLLSGLPKLRKLSFCGSNPGVNFDSLAALPHLEELEFLFHDSRLDLGFLEKLPNLRALKFHQVDKVDDWGPVGRLRRLESLRLFGCRTLTKFAPLADLLPQLTFLGLQQETADVPSEAQSRPERSRDGEESSGNLQAVRDYWKANHEVSPEWLRRLSDAAPPRKTQTPPKPALRTEVPPVDEQLFAALRQEIVRQYREWRRDGTLPTADEGLYAVGLFVMPSDGRTYLVGAANAAKERIGHPSPVWETWPVPDTTEHWLPNEFWRLPPENSVAEEANEEIRRAYTLTDRDAHLWDGFTKAAAATAQEELEARSLTAAALSLRDLDREGLFGSGAARENVVLMVATMDHDSGVDAETLVTGVRFLNGDKVLKTFLPIWARESAVDEEVGVWRKKVVRQAAKSEFAKRLATLPLGDQ